MRRRELLLGLTAVACSNLSVSPLQAQPTASGLHIAAILMTPPTDTYWVAFNRRLQELGYRDGKNLLVEVIDGREQPGRLVEDLKERISKGANIVVAMGTEVSIKCAMAATSSLPIVMSAFDYDPLALGYITSLSRPGGHITGLFLQQIELAVKRLELIHEAFPKELAAIIFWDKFSFDQWKAVETAAETLGMRVVGIELDEPPHDYEQALSAAPVEFRSLLIPMASPIFWVDRKPLIDLAFKYRLPMMTAVRELTEAGALMSYGVSLDGTLRRAAEYVDRIAKGAKPANLPVEQPTKFELVVNLRTARALGVELPPSLLARADEVIE